MLNLNLNLFACSFYCYQIIDYKTESAFANVDFERDPVKLFFYFVLLINLLTSLYLVRECREDHYEWTGYLFVI